MHNFTPEDLVQYLYQETSPSKTAEIKAALEADWSLREKLEVMRSAQAKLEPVTFTPREETIANIMEHAEKSLEVISTQA